MNKMKLKVSANHLEIVSDTYTTGGSVNYDSCAFEFDSVWNGFIKTAVFGFGNSDYVRVELQNDECKIPAVCLREEGIVKIGVYGINADEIVITTDNVAHRVQEGINEMGDWVEEDSYFIYDAIQKLEDGVDDYILKLDKRFDSLLTMVRKNGNFSDSDVYEREPDDWYVPSAFEDAKNIPSSTKKSEYHEYTDYILNKLTEEYPDYVSVSEIGMDASNTYPIYAYTFEPVNYEKTVLISAGVYAVESDAIISLSHFLGELCRNHKSSRTLSYLRSKVKLVVLPAMNPHSLVSGSAYNSNSVDINRNFPYRWEDCTSTRKGSAPADQLETAAAIELAESLASDKLCAAFDLKTRDNLYCSKMAFYPRFKKTCLSEINKTLLRFNYEEKNVNNVLSKTILAPSINPTFINYLAEKLGINTCSITFQPIQYGGSESNGSITKLTELLGNMLYTMAKNSTCTLGGDTAPFTKHFSWRSSTDEDAFDIASSGELKKVPISSYGLNLKSPCNLSLTGYVILKVTSACTVTVNPILWQVDSPEQTFADRADMPDFMLELPLSVGTHVVPINSVLQGYYSDDNGYTVSGCPAKVMFSLAVDASAAASAKLIGFSATLNAFESNLAKPLEISRPMGVPSDYGDEDDVPTQEIVYPIEAVTSKDVKYND